MIVVRTQIGQNPRFADRVCDLIRSVQTTFLHATHTLIAVQPDHGFAKTENCCRISRYQSQITLAKARFAGKTVFQAEAQREVPMQSGDDMLKQIVEKSALDSDFRQQLLADPKSTISQELGITIPESMTIQIHESDMQTVHLALPPDPHITEEQLEAISAGLCCCW